MSDQSLEILVKTLSDTHGVKEVQRELDKLKKTSEATHKEGAAAAKAHTKAHNDLHMAVKILGRQFGELGHMMHMAMRGPVIIAAVALAMAIEKIGEHFKEVAKQAEEARKKVLEIELGKINSLRDDTVESAKAMAAFNREAAKAGKITDPFAGSTFAGPEDEYGQRTAAAGALGEAAVLDAQKADQFRKSPGRMETEQRLKEARAKQEQLAKALVDAKAEQEIPEFAKGPAGESAKEYNRKRLKRIADAQSAFNRNEANITDLGASSASFSIGQANLDSQASISAGNANSNNARITALLLEMGRNIMAARSSQTGTFRSSGIGPAQSVLLPGAGAAATAISRGGPATMSDSMDYNQIVNSVRAEARKALTDALVRIFKDGVVDNAEAEEIRNLLKVNSNRQ